MADLDPSSYEPEPVPTAAYLGDPEAQPAIEQQTKATDRTALYDDLAERAVLGAVFHNPATADLITQLGAAAFGRASYANIARAVISLHADGAPIDPVSITSRLNDLGLDLGDNRGPIFAELVGISIDAPVIHADHHAARVRQLAAARSVEHLAEEAREAARTGDPTRALGHLTDAVDAATEHRGHGAVGAYDLVTAHLELLEQRSEHDGAILGIPTGLHDLDVLTGGLRGGQLAVVAGRPAMGKTAVACQFALHAAQQGHRTLLASLEMSRTELADRFIANLSGLDSNRLRKGQIAPNDWPRIATAVGDFAELPLTIDDDPDQTALDIAAAARHHQADVVIVDYLQLVTPHRRAENRQLEVTETTRALKRAARTLDIPIIALAQLSRAVEQRSDKHPQLSDLRESGAVEQEADLVIGLYRADYYKPNDTPTGVLELAVLKHRAGPIDTIHAALFLPQSRLANLVRSF